MKTMKVRVTNRQLNALEDLLYCELKPCQKRNLEGEVKNLWKALVTAWDRPHQSTKG